MPDYPAIDQTMNQALADGVFPGAVLLVARGEEVLFHRAYGFAALIPHKRPMSLDTVFDLASLTKPLATTLAVMALVAEGRLGLDQTFQELGQPFLYPGQETVSIRQLLAHTSGLPAYQPYYQKLVALPLADRKRVLRETVRREPLENLPGTITLYSDLGFMVLEWIAESLQGQDLHGWTRDNLYQPLRLKTMGFRPLTGAVAAQSEHYAATEECPWRRRVLCGEVHDENAYAVGGVSGQAGLFGTAGEVFRLLRALKNAFDQPHIAGLFKGSLVQTFWQRQPEKNGNGRALGFDMPSGEGSSAGRFFSPCTVGHLGFTGTSFWFDLDRDLLVILLTNRVHPTRLNEKIKAFRPEIHDRIARVFF
ncbi:MAG: serine hydrolase [Desulfobacterota bacterium]|jgi:CubicO group peptidase (beta-lactamase class C family)|nr:serine hydrolase [Thermodesulfobacteriota bacterium]